MSEVAAYRARVEAARREYAALPRAGWGEPGPLDAQTGERWDRGHVLGHVAEMVPFWTARVRAALAGATEIGRGERGYAERRRGIDVAHERDQAELLLAIDAGIAGLLRLLDELDEKALDRRVTYRSQTGDREVDLRFPIEELLVGHLEAHLRQLRDLD